MLNKNKILQILRKNFISGKFTNYKPGNYYDPSSCEACPLSNANTNHIWEGVSCEYRIKELTGKRDGAGSTRSTCKERIEFFKNLCKCKNLMETE